MKEARIEHLLSRLDGSGSDEEWDAKDRLKQELGDKLPYYLLNKYRISRKWNVRISCVYHAIGYARRSKDAFTLGMEALGDRSRPVRYRACMLLAYSQNRDALPELWPTLKHKDQQTREDVKAAIDAIVNQNHHYFVDREHTGKVRLNVT